MKLTRMQLYARVWEKPMTKLSQEFGLSDVGLAKICRKNGIPLPDRGYWAKVGAGKKVVQKTIQRKDYDPVIEITEKTPITDESIQAKQQLIKQQKERLNDIGQIEIRSYKSNPHRLTRMTVKHFDDIQKKLNRETKLKDPSRLKWEEREPLADNGRYRCFPEDGYYLKVSMSLLERALNFLDTLMKELEKNGFKILPNLQSEILTKQKIEAVKDNEYISFKLIEGYKQKLLTPEELKIARENYIWASAQHRVPSETLTFTLQGNVDLQEKKYIDGKKKIEDQLPSIVLEFSKRVENEKVVRLEKAQKEEEQKERRRIFELNQKRQNEQKLMFEQVVNEANRLDEYKKVIDFLELIETKHANEIDFKNENITSWFNLIRGIAEQKNPIKNKIEYLKYLATKDKRDIIWL